MVELFLERLGPGEARPWEAHRAAHFVAPGPRVGERELVPEAGPAHLGCASGADAQVRQPLDRVPVLVPGFGDRSGAWQEAEPPRVACGRGTRPLAGRAGLPSQGSLLVCLYGLLDG